MKKILVPIGIGVALIAAVLCLPLIVKVLDAISGPPPVPQAVLEARQRRADEAKRWASLTPEQQATETNARILAEESRKAEQAKILAAKRKTEFNSKARSLCRSAITVILHDPDSAKFERSSNWALKEIDENTVQIQPILRAKNVFGAYRLVAYICVIKNEGNDSMRILQLRQLD